MYDLMSNAKPAHATNKNRFKTDCPFCGKEDHFYFDIKTKSGICFVCMDKHIKLGPDFLMSPEEKAPNKSLDDLRATLSRVFDKPLIESTGVNIDLFSEPINSRRHPRSLNYLLNERGLSMEDVQKYDIRSGKSYKNEEGKLIMKWTGRVIFPFYENGVCVYAIGRTYMGDDRKYINVDVPKSNIVYGIDKIENRECIICEGFLSAVAAEKTTGMSSVCLLGKTISPLQLYKIRTKADRVWMSLDGGVPEGQVKSMARSLMHAGLQEVWRVDLPGEADPDDLGDDYLKYFDKATIVKYL